MTPQHSIHRRIKWIKHTHTIDILLDYVAVHNFELEISMNKEDRVDGLDIYTIQKHFKNYSQNNLGKNLL